MNEAITSPANPRIKAAAALKDAKARRETGCFLIEGARLCADAAESGVTVETLFFTERAAAKYPAALARLRAVSAAAFSVSSAAAARLADTAASQELFCVCRIPARSETLYPGGLYLMTEEVQNPDNLGALARSAEAFGAAGLILAGGCDPYAPKALRASMGALLRLPQLRLSDAPAFLRGASAQGFHTFAAVLSPDASPLPAVNKTGGAIVVIGNEGSGVRPETAAASETRLIIPMAGATESLNAAVAGSIILWEFSRARRREQVTE